MCQKSRQKMEWRTRPLAKVTGSQHYNPFDPIEEIYVFEFRFTFYPVN